jgi:hypothetical protein
MLSQNIARLSGELPSCRDTRLPLSLGPHGPAPVAAPVGLGWVDVAEQLRLGILDYVGATEPPAAPAIDVHSRTISLRSSLAVPLAKDSQQYPVGDLASSFLIMVYSCTWPPSFT